LADQTLYQIKDRPMSNNIDAQLAIDLGKATHLLARALQPLMEQLAGWASCRGILRNAVPTDADASVGFPGNGQVIDPALGLRPGQRCHTGLPVKNSERSTDHDAFLFSDNGSWPNLGQLRFCSC
jgi:hypothetical protein